MPSTTTRPMLILLRVLRRLDDWTLTAFNPRHPITPRDRNA
jgi:hypothetical protein